jgi:hypothetical protein
MKNEVFDNLVSLMLFGSRLNGKAICFQVNDQKRSKKDIFIFFIVSPLILKRMNKITVPLKEK